MNGIYKIGLTTHEVKERISQLHTTGVPKKFKSERIYKVETQYLRKVELRSHALLKKKGYHHAKEFFECSLADCENAVQAAIEQITSKRAIEEFEEQRKLRNRFLKEKNDAILAKKQQDEILELNSKEALQRRKLREDYVQNRRSEWIEGLGWFKKLWSDYPSLKMTSIWEQEALEKWPLFSYEVESNATFISLMAMPRLELSDFDFSGAKRGKGRRRRYRR